MMCMIGRTRLTKLVSALTLALGLVAPPRPGFAADSTPAPPCVAHTAACLQKIANLYLEALLSHDGSKLPLGPDVRRTENALTNARGPFEVRESFARTMMVEGVRDVRFYVDAPKGEVVVFFRLDVDLKAADAESTTRAGNTEYKVAVTVPEGTYTVHEVERFRIVHGLITEIEIVAHVEKGKGAGSGWPVPRDPVVSEPAAQH
jgi:hypothetical protein